MLLSPHYMVTQTTVLDAIQNGQPTKVRQCVMAIWNDWPDSMIGATELVLVGETAELLSRKLLVVSCLNFLKQHGWGVVLSDGELLTITCPTTGKVWRSDAQDAVS